jgi:hypothetical protein
VPCLALGGEASQRRSLGRHFALVAALTDVVSREEALARAGAGLRRLAERVGLKAETAGRNTGLESPVHRRLENLPCGRRVSGRIL